MNLPDRVNKTARPRKPLFRSDKISMAFSGRSRLVDKEQGGEIVVQGIVRLGEEIEKNGRSSR
jgi:hypothetical protein